jgi:hypothetical protein
MAAYSHVKHTRDPTDHRYKQLLLNMAHLLHGKRDSGVFVGKSLPVGKFIANLRFDSAVGV